MLFARDTKHALLRRFAATVDGKYQTLGAKDGAYNLTHFFDEDPEVRALVAHMSDRDIDGLKRGGHDFRKLFAAFEAALRDQGTADRHPRQDQERFWHGRRRRIAHDRASGQETRCRGAARVPRSLRAAAERRTGRELEFYRPADDSAELRYLTRARAALGGVSAGAPARPRRRCPCRRSQVTPISRSTADGKDDVDDDGRGAAVQQSPEGRDARAAHRADRRRRSAHVRHGEFVPPGRDLFARRPAL